MALSVTLFCCFRIDLRYVTRPNQFTFTTYSGIGLATTLIDQCRRNARLTLLYKSIHGSASIRLINSGSPRDTPDDVELIHSSHFLPALYAPSVPEQLSTGMLFLAQSVRHHQRNPSEQHSTDHLPPHPVPAVNSVTLRQ